MSLLPTRIDVNEPNFWYPVDFHIWSRWFNFEDGGFMHITGPHVSYPDMGPNFKESDLPLEVQELIEDAKWRVRHDNFPPRWIKSTFYRTLSYSCEWFDEETMIVTRHEFVHRPRHLGETYPPDHQELSHTVARTFFTQKTRKEYHRRYYNPDAQNWSLLAAPRVDYGSDVEDSDDESDTSDLELEY